MSVIAATRRAAARPRLESLEDRCLPSVSWPGLINPVAASDPDNTWLLAQPLGNLNDPTAHPLQRAEVVGNIGQGSTGAADVDWFQFSLGSASTVTLGTLDQAAGSPFISTLSLYTFDTDLGDIANDPYNQFGFRLLARDDGAAHGGDASVTRTLGVGTYYVAVSGSDNGSFHPYVGDSGLARSTGDYGLLITANALGLGAGDGPVVLSSDPAPGDSLNHSPLVLRVDLSSPLDLSTIDANPDAGQTVHLLYWSPGTFGRVLGTEVPFAAAPSAPPFGPSYFTDVGNELQLIPGQRLQPGTYQLVLYGDQSLHPTAVLADPAGSPLGSDASNPQGSDFTATFQVTGVEGNTSAGAAADDTYATAHDFGDISNSVLRQAAGTIGDDPWYDYNSPDPLGIQNNPSNDVDLYHFTLSGPGDYTLTADTFAGRVGSPLLPQNTLYRVTKDVHGNPVFTLVGSNSGSLNATQYTDANGLTVVPFANDPVLYAGLQAGEYVLAVSTVGNQPDLTNLDNQVSHNWSGGNGTTGDYVLNLLAVPDTLSPQVDTISVAEGASLGGPLTAFTVQFNKLVNLPANSVYVVGSDNQPYAARLMGYDEATNTASFLMLDGLPVGPSVLHLSGSAGLTDLFGNPLAGNPTGDYVIHFSVGGNVRGTGGAKPLVWSDQGAGNTTQGTAQVLGPLFPLELQSGVTITRDFSTDPASSLSDTDDYFQFQLLQSTRQYGFNLTNLASGQVTLIDGNGHVYTGIDSNPPSLDPGTYWLHVTGWALGQSSGTYGVQITLGTTGDNPPPLTAGAAPAIRVSLASVPAPTPPAPPAPPAPPTPPTPPAPPTPAAPPTPPTPSPASPPAGGNGDGTSPGTDTSQTPAPTPAPTVGPTPGLTTPVVVQVTPATSPSATPAVIDPGNGSLAPVVPALLRVSTGDAGGLTSLPAGSLIVLSTGPLGGVRGAETAGAPAGLGRLVLPGGGDTDPNVLASPALFERPGARGGGGAQDFIDWGRLLQGYHRLLEGLWRVGVEEVPVGEEEGDEVSTQEPSAFLPGALPTIAFAEDGPSDADAGEAAIAFAPSDGTWRSLTANRLAAPGWFALGLIGLWGREDPPGVRQGPRGRTRKHPRLRDD